MPKFCPECGTKLANPDIKFCSECGTKMTQGGLPAPSPEPAISRAAEPLTMVEPETDQNAKVGTYELGVRLEEVTERILKAGGWSTDKRVRKEGKSGTKAELDIIATRKRSGKEMVLAVECKNYNHPVPIQDFRNFTAKLNDVGIGNGLFVTSSYFSSGAKNWAADKNVMLWDRDVLMQKLLETEIGRTGEAKSHILPFAYPVKILFENVTTLNLKNRQYVEVLKSTLIWKPFYKVHYKLDATARDPSGKTHKIREEGYVAFDAMSGRVLSALSDSPGGLIEGTAGVVGGLIGVTVGTVAGALLGGSRESNGVERNGNDYDSLEAFSRELKSDPLERYPIEREEGQYTTIWLKPETRESSVRREATKIAVQKNKRTIEYYPKKGKKRKDEDPELPEYFRYIPPESSVRIKEVQEIYIPEWDIEFTSKEYVYRRVVVASSGEIFSDTIAFCPEHTLRESLKLLRKSNIAVCETCGKAQCESHIFDCATCKTRQCQKHATACLGCQRNFCLPHIPGRCADCNNAACENCLRTCLFVTRGSWVRT